MQQEHLLWELEESILSRIPLKSVARFRSVCKRWNTLLNDLKFINNHLARPQFVLISESKTCSVDVNFDGPSIEVHDLPSDIPNYEHRMVMRMHYCEGLLIYATSTGFGICNPWLRRIRWIKSKPSFCWFIGMGYDYSKPDNHYKLFGSRMNYDTRYVNTTEVGSNAWKSYEFSSHSWSMICSSYTISLNGTLYWIAVKKSARQPFILSFDFSIESLKPYCNLPGKNDLSNVRVLEIYRRDRFSILEQDWNTRNIEIWVTKDTIKNGDGESVEWMKFMNVLVPIWSNIVVDDLERPSYFIDEKSNGLALCCINKNGNTCIYIVKGDKFHEIEINELVGFGTRHLTYYPSFVPLPTGANDAKSHFVFPRGVEATNGVGENEWDDGFFDNVKKISVGQSDTGVAFVKFDYSNNKAVVIGAVHGNATHITYDDVLIDDDDYIEAVEGTYNDNYITSLTFRLHKRKIAPRYGPEDGTPFVLRGGGGRKIIGFYGRNTDVYLTAFGVHRNVPF
uniref:Jacalin-type lectin domain-containing protein n=1 Tax=Brassica campestris TaxID=3711 RepID=M4DH16_BRACM